MQVTSYLSFNGECETAFKFYEKCFGGTIEAMITHGETPAAEHVPADWQNTIMHARLKVGDSVLMGGDAPPDRYAPPQGFSVSLHPTTPEDADRIFNELAESGTVLMPIQETFWATRFGMVTDKFGTPWMINCERSA